MSCARWAMGMTDEAEDADLVVLNTCHIRDKATEKVYSELGRIKRLKASKADAGGEMIVAVAGCVAQAEGAEIIARQPAVDLVVGPQSYHRLPELIARAHRQSGEPLATDFAADDKFDALAPTGRSPTGVSAFLTVQEGCDKFCTFCVVPYTRGAEYSRPAEAIEAEARALAAQGVREVTLLEQNVNAYDGIEGGLGDPGSPPGQDRRPRPHPLYDEPPRRHGRRPDRRPRGGRGADALSAPAGAGGVGPGAEGDEPGSYSR